MGPGAILYPVFGLVAWTFLVLLWVAAARLNSKLRPSHVALGESDSVPTHCRLANRNYMNLLELPMLFYAACGLLYTGHGGTSTALPLAWAYVALRVAHSLVHLTYNNVIHRLLLFAISNFLLMGLWVVAFVQLTGAR